MDSFANCEMENIRIIIARIKMAIKVRISIRMKGFEDYKVCEGEIGLLRAKISSRHFTEKVVNKKIFLLLD